MINLLALSALLLQGPQAPQASQAPYHVAGHIALPGEGGWDYLTVDTVAHRLYVSRGTHVAVIDLDHDFIIGDIPNTNGVHSVAFARALNRGFISDGRDTTVTVFDLRTLATIGTIKVTGRNPDAIAYDPVWRRVFTFNGGSANVTAIDAQASAMVGTLDVGGKPEFAVSDGRGHMYVNIEDKSELVAFDPRRPTTRGRGAPPPRGREPPGPPTAPRPRRVFPVRGSAVGPTRAPDRGRVSATEPIGNGVDG